MGLDKDPRQKEGADLKQCPICEGKGKTGDGRTCNRCGGKGKVPR